MPETSRKARPETARTPGTPGSPDTPGTPHAPEAPDAPQKAADPATPSPTPDDRPKRRQARGERRIAQLLEAAATVFTTTGYTAASTNAIAREAGVSPGTLYQFFPNKEAIAIELGERLVREMREAYGTALRPVAPETPLEEVVGAAVDRFIAFNCDRPVFFTLMHGPDVPGRIAEEHDALHMTLLNRVQELLFTVLPETPAPDIERIANVCLSVYKAGVELILATEGSEREAYVHELKTVLIRYLQPFSAACRNHPGPPTLG
ncbi:TetR family transcriptional regulator [Streptomyces sp. NPDC093252]|uniref:TetR family transcriptional regulator n=1 Tax=Streptomyces sp. NPDC093252 TaxID=3154980 RepID=UPI0034424149